MPLDLLDSVLRALPPVAEGHCRLYRIQSTAVAAIAPWIQEAQQADGTALARGRWFTHDPEALRFYLEDTSQPELVILDLLEDEARACRLDRLPGVLPDGSRPRSFSRDPETEHFVPPAWATRAQRWAMVESCSPPHPRRRGPF